MAKRSSWLSTRGKVPRCDRGFWVDLMLFHGLQQGGLRARRGPVQLVEEHHVGEDRSLAELPTPRVGREHRDAGDVGGEEVRVALYPGELHPEGGGKSAGQHRLAHSGHVLNEQMTAG